MSWKDDFIAKHGEEVYAKKLEGRRKWGQNLQGGEKQRSQDRRDANPEQSREYDSAWRERNPEKIKVKGRKVSQKGGAYYKNHMKYRQTGIQGERERIRVRHGYYWRPYKNIIAPGSQLHHNWIPGTAEYTGLALVDADKHMHGVIDVIKILKGEITLFTEREIREKQEVKNIKG